MGAKQNIIDIDLSMTRRKRFRVDKDNNRIVELNTSDLTIVTRLKEAYPKLQELTESIKDDSDESELDWLKEVDEKMRKLIDYIFDSNVSEICAPDGTMYDMFEGQFRYEYIIDVLGNLYETNMSAEVEKMRKRVEKHTSKYTGK